MNTATTCRRAKRKAPYQEVYRLRISDAVNLSTDRITDDKLFLYTQKTGTAVNTVLPPFVVKELAATPRVTDKLYFWSGNGELETAVKDWQAKIRTLFDLSGVDKGENFMVSHRLRDTFAVECLLAGVPLERVSILLGHSTIKVTERHYAPWIQMRAASFALRSFQASAPLAARVQGEMVRRNRWIEIPVGKHRLLGDWRADRLNLCVKFQRFMSHVAPPTGLFISAKRHSRIHDSIAVDPDSAGAKLGRNSVSLGDVACPHPGGEAVGCVVRFRNEVIDIFERNGGNDGPETITGRCSCAVLAGVQILR